MKRRIVHICLASSYNDGWGYQENLLAQSHAKMGLDVWVLTSDYKIDSHNQRIPVHDLDYINEYGIHIKSLNRRHNSLAANIGCFRNVYETLMQISPDIIFVHGGQFYSLNNIVKYCSLHSGVRLYIDNHCDYYNRPIDSIKAKFLHRIIYGYWMRRAEKYCSKFWGVTPTRCRYLNDVYGISESKIGLLVMGGDDGKINLGNQSEIRKKIRGKYNISEEDFLIISGGKIDKSKNIHKLIKVISEFPVGNIKLLLFGQPDSEMANFINNISTDPKIIYIGWIDSSSVYDYFLSADLAVFPGTHSVLWEQACSCGLPAIFKYWEGMNHVDVGGNCVFLKSDNETELKNLIIKLYNNTTLYSDMKSVAMRKAVKEFSYNEISLRAIDMKVEQL